MNIKIRIAAAAALGASLLAGASAQTVRTHVSNGSASQLYDVVFLGDGYRSTEETQFLQDVDDCIAYWRDQGRIALPYGDYFQCYNFHSVFRASAESGIDNPNPPAVSRNTAYGASYGVGDDERCITLNAAGRTLAMNDRALAPGTENLIIVLCNDSLYGGCASGGIACSYNGSQMEDVNIHEWSHVYASLADEYDGDPGCYAGAEPSAVNVTANAAATKWSHWTGAAGPNSTVGSFEGAQYWDRCKYRPESDCEMRNLFRRFCAVCRERTIRVTHQRVTMVYSPSASTTNTSASQHSIKTFFVSHRIPAATTLIEWKVDGGPWVPGSRVFNWSVGDTSPGTHNVYARITDTTEWVRVGTSDLDYIKTWNVTVNSNVADETDFWEIIPDNITNQAGNSSSSYPWNQTSDMRVMYAYGGDAITTELPVEIRGIQFRPNENTGAWGGADYQFSLEVSTTQRDPTNLSRTFDNNHGRDKVLVFDGVITVPAAPLGANPNPFVITIPFYRAFQWDPRCGALLLDFKYRDLIGGSGISCDAVTPGDGNVGRIGHLSDADATTANFPSAGGTQPLALVANLLLDCGGAPVAQRNTEGNGSTAYPWNRTGQMRVQYVYSGSVVGLDGINQKITRLAWRTNGGAGWSGARVYDLTVSMSTGAPGLASALSTNFMNNHGPDRRVVFEGSWRFGSTAINAAPSPFNQVLELQRPFDYSADAGSLVVDIQMHGVTGATQSNFDAQSSSGLVGRVYHLSNSTAPGGSIQNDLAAVMCVSAVPQPIGPYIDDGAPGGTSTSYPWGTGSDCRTMYFYDTSGMGSGAQNITHLSWRPEENSGEYGPLVYNARIDLSTAEFFVNDLGLISSTFDDNHGDDRISVFNGNISVPYRRSSGSPADFLITVKLDQPFHWPGTGALVVDIRRSSGFVAGGGTQSTDGSFSTNDVARIYHSTDRNATTKNGGPQDFAVTLKLGGEGANAEVRPYGTACNGQNGDPIGSTRGLPWTGNFGFGFAVYDGPTSSNVALLLGSSSTSLPLAILGVPCDLLVGNIWASFGAATNGAGDALIPAGVPLNPSSDGLQMFAQWVCLDLTAPGSLTTSNGNRLTVRH